MNAVILLVSLIAFTYASEEASTCSSPCVIGGFAGTCNPGNGKACPPCYAQNGASWNCFDKAGGKCPWAGMTDCSAKPPPPRPPPPPPPPRSPPPPTVSPPPPSVAGRCPKRGLAYTFPDSRDMQAVSKGISWSYNWAIAPTQAEQIHKSLNIEFVPMVWGQQSLQNGPPPVPGGSKFVLGFNEPNFVAQSNLAAPTAAGLWPKVQQSANQLQIVSPALNFCGGAPGCHDTDPVVYLDKFFANCHGCKVDYIAVHWYGCTGDSLKWFLNLFRKYNKKLWVTEFSCAQWDASWKNSIDFQINYMKEAVRILENDPMVFRYAWFSGRTNEIPLVNIFSGTGQLTQLGQAYISQPCGAPVGVAAIAGTEGTLSTSTETTEPALQTTLVACVVLMSLVLLASILVVIILVLKQRVTVY